MHIKRTLAALIGFGALAAVSFGDGAATAAGWPSTVTTVTSKPNDIVSFRGDLKTGKTIDLGFAANSSVACFPATQNINFEGNHVFFGTQIPAQSEMIITVTPDDPKLDVSLYAYMLGSTDFTHVAPDLPSCVSCEAGYDAKTHANPGKPETVKLDATTHPYNVVIGVAGVKGTTSGGFTVKVDLKSRVAVTSAKLTPIDVTSKPGGAVEVTGSLDKGGVVDLGWAANSSVACFPATENVNFAGNHVIYRTQLPKESQLVVTATPKDPKLDLSVYAYAVSTTDTTSVPPNVSQAVSCSAGYDAKNDANPGVAETAKLVSITNPYNVYIGVAGAKGFTTGDYTLKIELKAR